MFLDVRQIRISADQTQQETTILNGIEQGDLERRAEQSFAQVPGVASVTGRLHENLQISEPQ
ncbi:hypothetical protein [Actinoplanes subtropicus]|uniref:hypothetical protein n=1 Tax=Actinoplanes subtropicus TaxID=543632 RepID=UPI0004C3C903|nr:hypothetical protein [Actinoplanes subtropicus]